MPRLFYVPSVARENAVFRLMRCLSNFANSGRLEEGRRHEEFAVSNNRVVRVERV